MTRGALFAALVLVSSLTACSGPTGTGATAPTAGMGATASTAGAVATAPSSSPAVAPTGAIAGTTRLWGGPVNPATKKSAMNGQAVPGYVVPVLSGTTTVASGISDEAGRFRIALAPGHYVLGCSPSTRFTIVAGATVTLDCQINVP